VSIDASAASWIIEENRAFYAFLKREYRLEQADACLRVLSGDAVKKLEAALSSMARPARSQGSDGAPRSSTGHEAATHTRAPTQAAQAQAATRAARARRVGGSARTRMLGSVLSASGTQNLQRNAVVFCARSRASLSLRCCTGRSRPASAVDDAARLERGIPSGSVPQIEVEKTRRGT
jgi:hypothetical protein